MNPSFHRSDGGTAKSRDWLKSRILGNFTARKADRPCQWVFQKALSKEIRKRLILRAQKSAVTMFQKQMVLEQDREQVT
jgi:hypothetical protein